jgi:hypothetical protein
MYLQPKPAHESKRDHKERNVIIRHGDKLQCGQRIYNNIKKQRIYNNIKKQQKFWISDLGYLNDIQSNAFVLFK